MAKSTSRRHHRSSTTNASAKPVAAFESLEGRRMFVAIAGTAGADVIGISQSGAMINVTLNGVTTSYGGPIAEVRVDALAGNDRVTTSAGITIPVKLYGGDGHDSLTGGSGHDMLDGGAGADVLKGQNGNDYIHGMAGNDQCFGGTGNDWIYGGHGNDSADGESGIDRIFGNGQPDVVLEPVTTYSTYSRTTTFTTTALRTATQPTYMTTTANLSPTYTTKAGLIGDVSPYFYTDHDVLHGGNDTDYLYGHGGNDAVFGDHGSDEIYGDDGHDRLYGGYGDDRLYAGNGDDVLVTIGGGVYDRAYGMAGFDSFWMDDARTTELPMDGEAAEFAGSNFHFVNAFEANVIRNAGVTTSETPSKELTGQNLADPLAITPYASFRDRPLFGAAGPQANDVRQGFADDCYFMAGLSAVAKQNPNRIRQSVVDLGDGTYAVQFFKLGKMRYYRVDGDLPSALPGAPDYAGLGNGGSTWVAIMEKAFTFHRYFDGGTYDAIGFGKLAEPFDAVAMYNYDAWGHDASVALAALKSQLDLGKAVTVSTYATLPANSPPVVARHAYSVHAVDTTNGTVTVRNPWGYDYYSGTPTDANPNDGYITFTAAQFYSCFNGGRASNV